MSFFDKMKQGGEMVKMAKQAKQMQKKLGEEKIEVIENGIRLVITGDMKIQELEIDGAANQRLVDALNKGMKKAQEAAAKKMQEEMGGLGGMMEAMGR